MPDLSLSQFFGLASCPWWLPPLALLLDLLLADPKRLPHPVQGIGWLAISHGLAGARPALAGLVLLLQPTLSYVWDVLFFAKPTGPVELAGVALALAGIYVGSTQRN